jgi:hypothetical protein
MLRHHEAWQGRTEKGHVSANQDVLDTQQHTLITSDNFPANETGSASYHNQTCMASYCK